MLLSLVFDLQSIIDHWIAELHQIFISSTSLAVKESWTRLYSSATERMGVFPALPSFYLAHDGLTMASGRGETPKLCSFSKAFPGRQTRGKQNGAPRPHETAEDNIYHHTLLLFCQSTWRMRIVPAAMYDTNFQSTVTKAKLDNKFSWRLFKTKAAYRTIWTCTKVPLREILQIPRDNWQYLFQSRLYFTTIFQSWKREKHLGRYL